MQKSTLANRQLSSVTDRIVLIDGARGRAQAGGGAVPVAHFGGRAGSPRDQGVRRREPAGAHRMKVRSVQMLAAVITDNVVGGAAFTL
jgi:hypothetical protein